MSKDFDSWTIKKKWLNYSTHAPPHFYEREIWFCSIGVNIGIEEDGKNNNFERPVIIFKKFNSYCFIGLPLTTKLKPSNPYYLEFKTTNLQYSAIASQVRFYDAKRLQRRLYKMSKKDFYHLHLEVKKLIIKSDSA